MSFWNEFIMHCYHVRCARNSTVCYLTTHLAWEAQIYFARIQYRHLVLCSLSVQLIRFTPTLMTEKREREKKRLNEREMGWEHEREVRNEVSGCEGGSGEAYRQATASACVGEWEKWTSGHRHWKGKDVSTWEFGRSTSASVKPRSTATMAL